MSKIEDKLLDHNYDGIEEYDNPLPGWWVGLFVLTVIIGGIYIYWYHIVDDGGLKDVESYRAEFEEFKDQQRALISSGKAEDNTYKEGEEFIALVDKSVLAKGEKIFNTNCASCHRADLGGQIGPNLTDEYWIHGGKMNDIVATIVNGVPENGMISWKPILKKKDIIDVASYIISKIGSNPVNPKAPQGTLPEEPKEEIKTAVK